MKLVAESHLKPEAPKHDVWGPTTTPDALQLAGTRTVVQRNGRSFAGVVRYSEASEDFGRCFVLLDCGSTGWFSTEDLHPEPRGGGRWRSWIPDVG